MPQAIEWSLATPKISAFLPSSRPIRPPLRRPEHSRYAAPMTSLKPTLSAAALRNALTGVRALLLDLDGVIVVAGEADSRRGRGDRRRWSGGASRIGS